MAPSADEEGLSKAEAAKLPEKEALARILKKNASLAARSIAADGPYPLAEEEVKHHGTVQKYLCWQRGPNSLVHLTLPELYRDSFCRFSDQDCLVYAGSRLTYGQAMERATLLARELAGTYGVQRGDRVAIAGRNHHNWVIALLAVTGHLSAVAVPVNSLWIGDELRYGLEDSGSRLLIADLFVLQRAPFLREIGVQAICMDPDAPALPENFRDVRLFDDVVAAGRRQRPMKLRAVDQDDTALLMYTSGTTSNPKGAVLTHRGVLAATNALRLITSFATPGPQPAMLIGSPLFHVNGLHSGLLLAFALGAKSAFLYKWDAEKALRLVQEERIQTLVGVPTMTYELLNHPRVKHYDTSSLEKVGGGGAAFAAPMIKRVTDTFKKARAGTGYGLTETNAISIVMTPALFPFRPASCGRPVANAEICILDDEGNKARPGEIGEICHRGAMIMKEYWRKPDKTAEAFHIDREGRLWFRSGDIGKMDEDNFVFIVDRAKDIINRGGENVSCNEVEGAMIEHPAVAEAVAFSLPDENLGEVVAVAVVFKEGESEPSDEELHRHASERLARFKVPSVIVRWGGGGLPRGATGKIQRREIREHAAAARRGGGALATPPPPARSSRL